MANVRIYKPAKTAMQSGRAKTRAWVLEFEPEKSRFKEPLMGWTGARDTKPQVCLRFRTAEEATAYATSHGLHYTLEAPKAPKIMPKQYSDNFAWDNAR